MTRRGGTVALAAGVVALVVARRADRQARAAEARLGALVEALALRDAPSGVPGGAPMVAIVIAAYEEQDAIGAVLDALPADVCGLAVRPVVVVDGGTDATAEVARAHGAHVVVHPVNLGQGAGLRTGFRVSSGLGADVVVTMDADGQHDPGDLPALVGPVVRGEADYVQGSRYLGRYDDAGGSRDVGIRGFTRLVNLLSGAGITDCTNGYRAVRGASLATLRLEERRFSAPEIIIEAARRGLRMREVPVHIRSRSHGESKKPRRLGYPLGFLGVCLRVATRRS